MSYEMMWIEKYRPRKIDGIIGHDEIKKRLKGFLDKKSIPHLLFAGPPGTGKTSAVLALAHEIFGENIDGNLLELNASDERGIDVIRNQVKEFARIIPSNDVPFKIISLDEADALTSAAQHALRRTMERYVATSRFILLCNYPGKIIEPIQSRCAFFRFNRLPNNVILTNLKSIADKEKVEYNENGIEVILKVSEGDMRKAINILQATAAVGGKITKEKVLNTTGGVDSDEIKELMNFALNQEFENGVKKLQDLLYNRGVSGADIVRAIQKEIIKLDISKLTKVDLFKLLAEIDFRLTEGASSDIQLTMILAALGNASINN